MLRTFVEGELNGGQGLIPNQTAKFYASHFRWVVPRTNMTGLAIAKFYASRLR